jgi:hypothetical protein
LLCWIAIIGVVAVFANVGAAQRDQANQRAMIANWAGRYNTEGFLKESAVREELLKLLGGKMDHLLHKLNVRGVVDLSGETLSVNRNAPH